MMTTQQAFSITEALTGINPQWIDVVRCNKAQTLARQVCVLLLFEEGYKRGAIAEALGTGYKNIDGYIKVIDNDLCHNKAFKKLYWRLRAMVDQLEDNESRAAA